MSNNDIVVAGDSSLDDEGRREIFESWLGSKSARTIKAYRENILRIAKWLGIESPPEQAGDEFIARFVKNGPGAANLMLIKFKTAMVAKKWAPAYINNHLAAVRSLLKFVRMVGAVTWTVEVGGFAVEALRETRGPGDNGLIELLDAAAKSEPKERAVRDVAILRFFTTMGLRREEVCSLDLEHVDITGSRAFVLRKRKSERKWLTIPRGSLQSLVAWIEVRGKEPGPLFNNLFKKTRLAASSFNNLIDELAIRAGLSKTRVHGLRHAAITTLLDETDGNTRDVQKFAGHSGPAMTLKYDDNREDVAGRMANLLSDHLDKLLAEKRGREAKAQESPPEGPPS